MDFTSNGNSNNGGVTQAAVSPKQQVGVADYFAILGVGEQLIWKHAQKQQSDDSTGTHAHNHSQGSYNTTSSSLLQEDDARLLERLYREIVDCSLWVADEMTEPTSLQPTTLVYATNQTSMSSTAIMSHPAALPSSPVPSYDTQVLSAVPTSTTAMDTEIETVEMGGWTIVQQTKPMSASVDANAPLWQRGQVWQANLDPSYGLSAELRHLQLEQQRKMDGKRKSSTPLKGLRERVQSTFQQRLVAYSKEGRRIKYYLSFRRRAPDEPHRPAIADMQLVYVQLHKATVQDLPPRPAGGAGNNSQAETDSVISASTAVSGGAAALLRVAEAGKQTFQSRVLGTPAQQQSETAMRSNADAFGDPVALDSLLTLPTGLEEWSIPGPYQSIRFPTKPPQVDTPFQTVLFPPEHEPDMDSSSAGIEAVQGQVSSPKSLAQWQIGLQPRIVPQHHLKEALEEEEYIIVPVLAIRRQRVGEEERFHEDPAIVDLAVSITDRYGDPVLPYKEVDPFEEEEDDVGLTLLEMTEWSMVTTTSSTQGSCAKAGTPSMAPPPMGSTCILVRKNIPLGFCDAAFSTSVLDRFPYKNYKGLPLPEEELPMFCYPTGCRLHRAKFCDAPLPQYYGFVVKNERGDSIYVSCVSFMEPLTRDKKAQLAQLSERRCRVSLPHAMYWARKERQLRNQRGDDVMSDSSNPMETLVKMAESCDDYDQSNMLFTGFEDMTTFENKTICLVSRYPYWSAFRRFLSHLQSVSGSSSDLPIERYISHLLLSVPLPKPGGPSVLVPLPTFNIPMVLSSPPSKDLPLVDLPYERLVSCLDIPTIVTVILGFLALEQKVIVMSTRPSLVLDVCELLRSLLFPFDLCAPYVPRLTEPFMSCLEFPGAIFVGIHNDGTPNGLAAVVRQNMPEDSTIVDLDVGTVDCSGDRMTVLNNSWGLIPQGPRSVLVSELETLCRDAGIVPGQEPLDSLVDPAFEATMPSSPVQDIAPIQEEKREPLDDRAIRDAFLRFFCSILGGYERFLVVPDVDFLISGNEWFDSKGFLASASDDKAGYLSAFVATQLFQSFIQRRTEASDVQCLLFDECLGEFHSAPMPYGRLGGDVETLQTSDSDKPQLLYSLLVDQSASVVAPALTADRSFDVDSKGGSDVDSSGHQHSLGITETWEIASVGITKNPVGDWVSVPSYQGLPEHARFSYCVDGNPIFPDKLNPAAYLPRQPESWLVEMTTVPTPMLTRSEREIEEAERQRRLTTTYRGLQTQRRCKWQLPKLMGSQFLGAYLLCTPALVSQPTLTHEQQSTFLLRALGALRLLRTKQRIVPDEAAYRALIVACGRTMTDRRLELVKLFGLLRSDGIFPSAVTLGQYTKALAEGYSKQRAAGPSDDETGSTIEGVADKNSKHPLIGPNADTVLVGLDGSLTTLEDAGRRWRQKSAMEAENATSQDEVPTTQESKTSDRTRKKSTKQWLPVVFSASFAPIVSSEGNLPPTQNEKLNTEQISFLSLWSRTKACDSCGYIPLDEEVQAGWDIVGGENDVPGAVSCVRCGSLLVPKLGYRSLSMEEAIRLGASDQPPMVAEETVSADFSSLPPQLRPTIDDSNCSYVTYVSPATLRLSLERHIAEHGEEILERERLRKHDPEIFYNLWWYCARFSLPLPLPVGQDGDTTHCWAMASWDSQVSMRGCWSAATVVSSLLGSVDNVPAQDEDHLSSLESLGDSPLLSRFNLQGHYATVWDHSDLSEVLVALVEACDKRDFRPVVESLVRANKRRRDIYGGASSLASSSNANSDVGGGGSSFGVTPSRSDLDTSPYGGGITSVELDCYRTALYLAKYQCTSAFHAFFPTTLRPCKGYHFWCPVAPVPIFDRLLHEATKRVRAKSTGFEPFHDVSDVALGFRCVFGHLM
eukprot:Nitzschia sp. Nitz4//scaffold68_size99682//38550//44354//NITZ4_004562-RA/size99682-snap-gene-0.8-mRNA-1//-1//CDS//3329556587//7686//frame0